MNATKSSVGYWTPLRPALIWPARILGLVFLGFALFDGISREEWRWGGMAWGMAFLIWSFVKPERKYGGFGFPRKTRS